jgi:hypothetical protein
MNKAQKIVVMVGLAAVLLVALFPPWRLTINLEGLGPPAKGVDEYLGCRSIFTTEAELAKFSYNMNLVDAETPTLYTTPYIDLPRLSLRLLAVVAIGALLTILVGMLTKRRT